MRTKNGLTDLQREIVALDGAYGCPPGIIAENHGLDAEAVTKFLGSKEGVSEMRKQREMEDARRLRNWLSQG